MQIQINTDNTIDGHETLVARLEAELRDSFGRFEDQITRLEMHLGDANGDKGGSDDKTCVLEARLAGRRPETVTSEAATIDAAVSGAVKKLRRLLDSTLGRLSDHKGAPSIRTGI